MLVSIGLIQPIRPRVAEYFEIVAVPLVQFLHQLQRDLPVQRHLVVAPVPPLAQENLVVGRIDPQLAPQVPHVLSQRLHLDYDVIAEAAGGALGAEGVPVAVAESDVVGPFNEEVDEILEGGAAGDVGVPLVGVSPHHPVPPLDPVGHPPVPRAPLPRRHLVVEGGEDAQEGVAHHDDLFVT